MLFGFSFYLFVFRPFCFDLCHYNVTLTRRQDSSIGFGAPIRANLRPGGLTSAEVTSSLLETV